MDRGAVNGLITKGVVIVLSIGIVIAIRKMHDMNY